MSLGYIYYISGFNIKYDENNFESDVKLYLMQRGTGYKPELVEYLIKKHKKELGYSKKSIIRKLDNLRKQNVIDRVPFVDYDKHGIKNTDKRSCYYILKSTSKITEHMDTVLRELSTEEPVKQKMALKEIARYEQIYFLNPEQLDLIVTQFDNGLNKEIIDKGLADNLLFLIYTYILKKGIEPANKINVVALLLKLLDKYPVPSSTNVSIRARLIYLLGHYGHEAVIEQFIKDARLVQDYSSIENVYNTEYTAGLIEEHREELYRLEEELAIEGKDNASQFVSNIRTHALINLGFRENPYTKKEADDW